ASASSTKMWRGTAFIAASTTSSRMPSARSRSTILARVRVEVIPMPDSLSSRVTIVAPPIADFASTREPLRDGRQFVAVRQIDLQRRERRVALIDRVEIRAFARIGCAARGADPVHGFAARILADDDVLRLVPAAEPR